MAPLDGRVALHAHTVHSTLDGKLEPHLQAHGIVQLLASLSNDDSVTGSDSRATCGSC